MQADVSGPGPRGSWKVALLAIVLTAAIVGLATLAGTFITGLYFSASGVMEPGVRAPGAAETAMASILALYFAVFQSATIALTVLAAPWLARATGRPVLAFAAPRGGFAAMLLGVIALLALAFAAGSFVYTFDKEAFTQDMRPFARMARSDGWWFLLLAAGLGAPLAEEMLFRGFLHAGLRDSPLGFAGAAFVSTVFWTILHASYSVYGLTVLMIIGLYLSWLRERTGSLWPSIVAHGVYNGLILLLLAFMGDAVEGLV